MWFDEKAVCSYKREHIVKLCEDGYSQACHDSDHRDTLEWHSSLGPCLMHVHSSGIYSHCQPNECDQDWLNCVAGCTEHDAERAAACLLHM